MSDETQNIIEEILRKFEAEFQPQKVYLFGSYAWGVPTADSDIDLFMLLDSSEESRLLRERKAYKSLRNLSDTPPIDILIRTKTEIESMLEDTDSLYYKIINQGQLLYERK